MNYIRWFKELSIDDIDQVGGKNASLGFMIKELSDEGVTIPNGFAITADAYWYFLDHNKLRTPLKKLMKELKNYQNIKKLKTIGQKIRHLIEQGEMPDDLAEEIKQAYRELSKEYKSKACDVAVRSSATAEDLPTASFAGQQETFLNVKGDRALIEACKKSMASLFTDRAIVYRYEHKFNHFKVALSVGVQKMVRADKGSAGVAFSLDPESGFKEVITIDSAWGLGESIVKGLVVPDEFYVFKPTLEKEFDPIIKKTLGKKKVKIVYGGSSSKPTKKVSVSPSDQKRFSLTNDEVIELAKIVALIDELYTDKNRQWTPMDIEWAKDGVDGKLYILQARPETVHAQKQTQTIHTIYKLLKKNPPLITSGQAIGQQIVSGIARVIKSPQQMSKVKQGDIIITAMTDPDWVPVMKKAAGIITDLGGRTCHAAIVSRELNTPAIVGTQNGTKKIKTGQKITIDCAQSSTGFVYKGLVPFEKQKVDIKKVPKLKTQLMVNIANPDTAFVTGMLPVDGVGLARIEFIVSQAIKIHPMALLEPKKITSKKVRETIARVTQGYKNKKQFFVDTLAQNIAMIAAAFYPRPVIVRLSDFKTNEYRDLIGGEFFEQQEANPMLGFRGASRYTHELYKDAFALECEAFKKVRDAMGFDNVMIMVPFVRTIKEADAVIELLAKHGLERKRRSLAQKLLKRSKPLKLVMMCEVPSNVLLINEFSKRFDGFSIGSNDLTQLVLGIDRDSALLSGIFDERDPAVKQIIIDAIQGAHKNKRFIGICGQAPSDYPEFAEFLIKEKIDSISLNPDSVLPFLLRF